MPLVKKIGAYEFRFGTRGEANEPPHIHVWRGGAKAKFWLTPMVDLSTTQRFKQHELTTIERLVGEHQREFLEAWHEFFS